MNNITSNTSAKQYLGLGKTLFNSSACLVQDNTLENCELVLSERVIRKKGSGAWPEHAINNLTESIDPLRVHISENRDVTTPQQFEEGINEKIPFYSYLQQKRLSPYSSYFNKDLKFITHHLCHAYAALAMSPFEKSIIIVMDGAGSKHGDFSKGISDNMYLDGTSKSFHEECSIYIHDGPSLKCVQKLWQEFSPSKIIKQELTEGVGLLYEKAAEYIFADKRAAGKVMGLAPFGQAQSISSPKKYLESLDWENSFKLASKKIWEDSSNMDLFKNIASSVQQKYEDHLGKIVSDLKNKFPLYDNLILTGGTALNCTNNYKLLKKNIFSNIYIPPFPSDECISFGAANYFFIKDNPKLWSPKNILTQHGFLGSKKSVSTDIEIENVFKGYKIIRPQSITDFCSSLLTNNHIIGWFQGRSEAGPRALGNRSILANPEIPNLKNHLNEKVKFRESFRPYGCSSLLEYAHEYFDVNKNFHNPYMSFATKIRSPYFERLKEVSHIDNSSRMQTVTKEFNTRFYDLIQSFGKSTGLYCLLNTSLNIMGEPIVETVLDARALLDSTDIYGIAVGDFFIYKNC